MARSIGLQGAMREVIPRRRMVLLRMGVPGGGYRREVKHGYFEADPKS
jgi:hypothetical protein